MNLSLVQIRYLNDLAEKRPLKKAGSFVAKWFCKHFGLGVRSGNLISYGEGDWDRARAMLQAHLGQSGQSELLRSALLPGQDRSRSLPGVSEKAGTRGPRSNAVAVKAMPGGRAAELDGVSLPHGPGAYVVLYVEDAMRIACDGLLVVENLEAFRRIDRHASFTPRQGTWLVIYRGDTAHSPADSKLLCAQRQEPVLWFGDFDPAGLGMALDYPRVERLLLPDSSWLETAAKEANRYDLYDRQMPQWGIKLDIAYGGNGQRSTDAWAWELMRALKRGLQQEAMIPNGI